MEGYRSAILVNLGTNHATPVSNATLAAVQHWSCPTDDSRQKVQSRQKVRAVGNAHGFSLLFGCGRGGEELSYLCCCYLSYLKEDNPKEGSCFIQPFWEMTASQSCLKHLCFIALGLPVIPAGFTSVTFFFVFIYIYIYICDIYIYTPQIYINTVRIFQRGKMKTLKLSPKKR